MKINPITLYSVKNTENTKKQQSKVSNPAFGMADLSQNKEEFEFF